MGLVSLQVAHFKSYDGVHDLPLAALPFVGVIGLNGSGKSNLLDAVCFVAGFTPARLRCERVEELVHSGSDAASMYVAASVSSATATTAFKRTCAAYYVDDAEVDEAAYCAAWAALNIGEGARNCVVLQSDVQTLTAADAQQRALFIEGASEDERATFEAEEAAVQAAAARTRSLAQRRSRAQAQHDSAREIGSTREQVQRLRHRIRRLERRRVVLSSREKRALLAGLRKQVEDAKQAAEACAAEAATTAAASKSVRGVYARKRRALQTARVAERAAAAAVAALRAQRPPLQKQADAALSEVRVIEPELVHAQESVAACERERESAAQALARFEREQERRARDAPSISEPLRALYQQLDDAFLRQTALAQDELQTVERAAAVAEQARAAAARALRERADAASTAQDRVSELAVRREQLETLRDERGAQRESAQEDIARAVAEAQKLRTEAVEVARKREECMRKLRDAEGDSKGLAQRHKLLDAVERLRLAHRGVHGVLGSLISPVEPQFALALEQAMGPWVDAIVVDDASVARTCIETARSEGLGVFRFLPVGDLRTPELASTRAQLADVSAQSDRDADVRLLVDCARIAQAFLPAFLFAVGPAVFVQSLKHAHALRRAGLRMRMITADGASLSANNLMSITNAKGLANAVSARARASLERRSLQLAERAKELALREQELQDTELHLNRNIESLQGAVEAAERELAVVTEQEQSAARELRHCTERRVRAESDLSTAETDAAQAIDRRDAARDELHGQRVVAFSSFLEQAGGSLDDWDRLLGRSAALLLEAARTRQDLEERLALASSRLNTAREHLAQQSQRQKALSAQQRVVASQIEEIDEELQAALVKLDKVGARVKAAHASAEEKSDEVGAVEAEAEAAQQRVADAEQEQTLKMMELASQLSAFDDDDDEVEPAQFADESFLRDAVSLDKVDEQLSAMRAELRPLTALLALSEDGDEQVASQECNDLDAEWQEARSEYDALAYAFAQRRETRRNKFVATLSRVQEALTQVYRELAGEGQAQLTPVSEDEPYMGVLFSVKPQGKTFTPAERLSGGEQSIAALGLLFAVQQMSPPPFVVLDEADAALDFANVASLARYLTSHSKETQFIVVSLKQRLYEHASDLVGVYKNDASRLLTVKL